jgi:DNA-binding transcriptional regulator GbsR (MarR family)
MPQMKITQVQLQLIERMGLILERMGLQPAAARIDALLLVSDELELTFDEIREILKISKSATSNALNMLLTMERVEYITRPGERKRYFRSKIGSWKESLSKRFRETETIHSLMKEILEQRPAGTGDFNKSMEEFISLFDYLHKEIPAIFKKWEAGRK